MTAITPADGGNRRDPERTKREILEVATAEFAASGFAGARVDRIAELTRTTKRMIYYYFESKESLYLQVMETAYALIRTVERELDVAELSPIDGLRALAEFTYDHHTSHSDFIRLVSIENIHRAQHISKSTVIHDLNSTAIDALQDLLRRGAVAGEFRTDIDALDVHVMISAYCFFHVSNRYTFRTLFGRDLLEPERHSYYRRLVGDMIIATMTDLQRPDLVPPSLGSDLPGPNFH
ncbi:transcriptional regulator, TetR family [Cryobacterium flavum]|uniref:TetR/AcrR family transcriptional regulator n=1 Tax=Cryobacterium flavum TaxID=1424659 RepID=A0A4R8UXP0_9MICO|nr:MULTISPECIES: TetR/AcrR family transcriptional regulator [Cryobacterium]TFB74266.1 TetR/AcrR family transcriptional regulator [Cryobacterium flavum]SDO14312.1 transcriptional regulator, TetR family [Cryobacterium flavum]